MVKLSTDMISRLGPGHNKRRPDETVNHYLNRLTHIYLQDKLIDGIELMPTCRNLTVIYLYDNNIPRIEHLEFAPNLTHLYLQNNKIKRLENLGHLTKLTKLHIGGNYIKVLEGLETMTELVELQIENQHLSPGETLLFDPRTILAIMGQLRILNISGNNLDSLNEIEPLSNLTELYASNNKLNDMKEMSSLLRVWFRVSKLELSGNPLCLKNKYRERIIVAAPNIEELDGKEIQDLERQFLQNWKESKEASNKFGRTGGELTPKGYMNELIPDFSKSNLSMPTYVMPGPRKKQLSGSSFKTKPQTASTTNIYIANNYSNSFNGLAPIGIQEPQSNSFSNNRFLSSTVRHKSSLAANGHHHTSKYPSSKSASVGNAKFMFSSSNNNEFDYMPR